MVSQARIRTWRCSNVCAGDITKVSCLAQEVEGFSNPEGFSPKQEVSGPVLFASWGSTAQNLTLLSSTTTPHLRMPMLPLPPMLCFPGEVTVE